MTQFYTTHIFHAVVYIQTKMRNLQARLCQDSPLCNKYQQSSFSIMFHWLLKCCGQNIQKATVNYFGIPPSAKKSRQGVSGRNKFSLKRLNEFLWLKSHDKHGETLCKMCWQHPRLADTTIAFYVGKDFQPSSV